MIARLKDCGCEEKIEDCNPAILQSMQPMELPKALENSDLIQQLLPEAIKLLERDFQTAGIDIELSGKIFGDVFDLRDLLAAFVLKTGGPGSESFYRLLYRADIPEAQTKKALQDSGKAVEIAIAELLVIRALQRAYYRSKFQS